MRGSVVGRTVVVVALAALLTPAPASAHLRTGTIAVDYEATVSSPRPSPAAPFTVGVYASDLGLHLSVRRGHRVVITGYLGEPFLRVGRAGVAVNSASPTAAAAGLLGKGRHASGGLGAWHLKRGRESVVWHDSRVSSLPPGARSSDWKIRILVDGRRSEIAGRVQRLRRPMLWPWLAVLALFAGAAAALARARRPSRLATSCIALGSVASAAAVVTALGFLLDSYASPGTWIAGGDEIAFAAAGAAVLIWAPPPSAHTGAGVGLGLLGLAVGLSKGPVFLHADVLSALPGPVARLFAAVSIGAGAAAAVLGGIWFTFYGPDGSDTNIATSDGSSGRSTVASRA